MVSVERLTKTFRDDAGSFDVLKETSMHIVKGEMVALVGVSGAGKTTLLQIIGGLDKPSSGTVVVEGCDIGTMKDSDLVKYRRDRIGFVFQFHHLLPDFSALENVFIPGLIKHEPRSRCLARARELMAAVGLERRFGHYPSELSGGERQRVALARALFNQPALVLADEPTGNLDTENARQLLELFRTMNKEFNQTFVVATHNDELADGMGRKVYIQDGLIRDTALSDVA